MRRRPLQTSPPLPRHRPLAWALSSIRTLGAGSTATLLLVLSAGCSAPSGPGEAAPPTRSTARAIVLSVDALNQDILRRTLSAETAPALFEVFDRGACADYATPAFPSLTAPGHASLWTGAYGDASGVSGNTQHRLPRDEHRVTDVVSGYLADALSAEPLWITAGRQGLRVTAHQTTQAPGAPGYLPRSGSRGPEAEARRRESEFTLATGTVRVVNGYNRTLNGDTVLSAADVNWQPVSRWRSLDTLDSGVAPRAFSFSGPEGSLHGLLYGRERYDTLRVSTRPDANSGVAVSAHEAEAAASRDTLARHFSPALEIPVSGGRVFLHLRLFELKEDGSDFLLFHPRLQVIEANTPQTQRDYDTAVRGWVGNSATGLCRAGAFGQTLLEGGDGRAEERYLESAELMTRQFMRAAQWLWEQERPNLMLDYFPLADSIDHTLLGYLDPDAPAYSPALATRIADFRRRVWRYVDMRVAHLLELVGADSPAAGRETAFFIAGDHGMRASWKTFHPNVALENAGLLTLDDSGAIDLARTRALSINGYWVRINDTGWESGVVPEAEREATLDAIGRALQATDPAGTPSPVETLYTVRSHPDLGLGGAAGGDVYWGLAKGYRNSRRTDGDAITAEAELRAGHGFPSTDSDMRTVFCAYGSRFPAGRVDAVRTIDVAPTVADFLGIEAPRDAQGQSRLEAFRRQ